MESPSTHAAARRGSTWVDFSNHRVLGWADGRTVGNGQTADLVLGQPNLERSSPFGIGNPGFNGPSAIAVHPTTGDVYVSDGNNNRVLRFPEPFANPERVEPDKVYGQPDFNSNSPNNGGRSERTLQGPTGLTFDRQGNLWICDTRNHRVVRYPASALDADAPEADLVIGQELLTEGGTNSGSPVGPAGFNTPVGVAFHPDGSLYVADAANFRVFGFPGPVHERRGGDPRDRPAFVDQPRSAPNDHPRCDAQPEWGVHQCGGRSLRDGSDRETAS